MDEYLETGKNLQRLFEEYKKHGSLTVGFDFDSTVHDYHKKGSTYNSVIELLRDMKSIGCTLICWTAYKDPMYVIKFLEENKIPFDGVNTDGIKLPWETRKPFFSALLDDRAGLIQVYNELRELADSIMLENKHDDEYESLTPEQVQQFSRTGIIPVEISGITSATYGTDPSWVHPGYELMVSKETWEAAKPNFDFSGLEFIPSIQKTAGDAYDGTKPVDIDWDEIAHMDSGHFWRTLDTMSKRDNPDTPTEEQKD